MVFFPKDKMPPLMIIKKDGATLYGTRDLATDKFRLEKYGKDVLVIVEVGAEQSLYQEQVAQAEQMLGWYKKGQRLHIKHGMYRFKDAKMATRKGNVIWLEDVLNEAKKRAFSLLKQEHVWDEGSVATTSARKGNAASKHVFDSGQQLNIAQMVSIGALKWNDLKRNPAQDIVFDWDDILNMQGNSGPYLQYTYVRTQSILRKVEFSSFNFQFSNRQEFNAEELDLLRKLAVFTQVVGEAAEKYSPHIICNYLFDLAQSFNLFYQKHSVLGDEDKKAFRLHLTAGVGRTIKEGLQLLGIASPERM